MEFINILKLERIEWAQRYDCDQRKFGNWNTKYFHIISKIKTNRAKIVTLKNTQGEWLVEDKEIKDFVVNHFC